MSKKHLCHLKQLLAFCLLKEELNQGGDVFLDGRDELTFEGELLLLTALVCGSSSDSLAKFP